MIPDTWSRRVREVIARLNMYNFLLPCQIYVIRPVYSIIHWLWRRAIGPSDPPSPPAVRSTSQPKPQAKPRLVAQPRRIAERRTIALFSSAQQTNIQGLLTMLRKECTPIDVRFLALPFNDLDSFRMKKGLYSGLILCHSIDNRRFAITNVLDALYDVFLPHARDVLGEKNVSVVAHDFQWPLRAAGARNLPSSAGDHAKIKEAHMESFRIRQPTTFQCSDLVMISGRLEDNVLEMDEEDKQSLIKFVNTRSTTSEEVESCQLTEETMV